MVTREQSSEASETPDIIRELSDALRTMSAQSVFFNQAIAEALGLSASDMRCIGLIGRGKPAMTPSQLAEATGLTTGAITGVVDRLERAGFVRRRPDPRDRRRIILEPVEERQPELAELFQSLGQRMHELSEYYTDDELRVILDFANRMTAILKDETNRIRQRTTEGGKGQR